MPLGQRGCPDATKKRLVQCDSFASAWSSCWFWLGRFARRPGTRAVSTSSLGVNGPASTPVTAGVVEKAGATAPARLAQRRTGLLAFVLRGQLCRCSAQGGSRQGRSLSRSATPKPQITEAAYRRVPRWRIVNGAAGEGAYDPPRDPRPRRCGPSRRNRGTLDPMTAPLPCCAIRPAPRPASSTSPCSTVAAPAGSRCRPRPRPRRRSIAPAPISASRASQRKDLAEQRVFPRSPCATRRLPKVAFWHASNGSSSRRRPLWQGAAQLGDKVAHDPAMTRCPSTPSCPSW